MATPATVRVGGPSQILGLNSYLGEIFRKNSGETTEQRQTLGCFPGEKRARAKRAIRTWETRGNKGGENSYIAYIAREAANWKLLFDEEATNGVISLSFA